MKSLSEYLQDTLPEEKTERAGIIRALSASAGIKECTVNDIIRGRIARPPVARLKAFATVLGTTLENLEKRI